MIRLRGVRVGMLRCRPPLDVFPHPLKHHVKQRNQKDSEERCRDHSAEHGGADAAPAQLSGAGGDDKRHQARDEGEARHHDGAEPLPGAFDGSLLDRQAVLAPLLGEFDDQDAVLRRQRDQHHQSDLGVKIVIEPERQKANHRA